MTDVDFLDELIVFMNHNRLMFSPRNFDEHFAYFKSYWIVIQARSGWT